jgi:hypothetical protein
LEAISECREGTKERRDAAATGRARKARKVCVGEVTKVIEQQDGEHDIHFVIFFFHP